MKKKLLTFLIASSLSHSSAMEFFPDKVSDLSNIVLGSPNYETSTPKIEVRIHFSCYRVNVRNQPYGLNTDSFLLMTLRIKNRPDPIKVVFPAGMFFGKAMNDLNKMKVLAPVAPDTFVAFDPVTRVMILQSQYNSGEKILTPSFVQTYLDSSGNPLIPSAVSYELFEVSPSREEKFKEVIASFPGALNHCGSYKSPLMLFFDKKRPIFSGLSSILNSDSPEYNHYWVEPNAPGYFLALDTNNDGEINQANELFAGFEKLSPFDSNHDGVIDPKDPVFTKLVLWNDSDGNGTSSKTELRPLNSLKISTLSLKYDNKSVKAFGPYAEGREFGHFVFQNAKGRPQKGAVIDMWFMNGPLKPQAIVKKF